LFAVLLYSHKIKPYIWKHQHYLKTSRVLDCFYISCSFHHILYDIE
jgi:hypothetical protein